jgi:glycosyltransferase involved in cell wall biosynthesis
MPYPPTPIPEARPEQRLRIALIAGSLGQGGAEKQLVYIGQALQKIGADVRIYSLTQGEYYEKMLNELGIPVTWFGRQPGVLFRLAELTAAMIHFRPHIVQAVHSFTNLYAVFSARMAGSIEIGAIRSNIRHVLTENGSWGWILLRTPRWIIANSYNARMTLHNPKGISKVFALPNVIDLQEFDEKSKKTDGRMIIHSQKITIITVARLIRAKRIDRLLKVMSMLVPTEPGIEAIIVGDGPERESLEKYAEQLMLPKGTIRFTGKCDDIPWILSQGDIFVLTSDDEGFPNVLLEAMAARLPIVTTTSGDCGQVVQEGLTGYLVDFDDLESMAERILSLARSPSLRRDLGAAGRKRAEEVYTREHLADQLLAIYRTILQHTRMKNVLG